MSYISIKGKESFNPSAGRTFSWQLAEISDRHNEMQDGEVTSTDILHKIHCKYDPGHKKALARLRREWSRR